MSTPGDGEPLGFIIKAVVDPEQQPTVPFKPGSEVTLTFFPCRCGQPGETWPCSSCLAAVTSPDDLIHDPDCTCGLPVGHDGECS